MKITLLIICTLLLSGLAFSGYNYTQEKYKESKEPIIHTVAMEGKVMDADRYKEANDLIEYERIETEANKEKLKDEIKAEELLTEENSLNNQETDSLDEIKENQVVESSIEKKVVAEENSKDEIDTVEEGELEKVVEEESDNTIASKATLNTTNQEEFNGKSNLNVKNYLLPQSNSSPRIENLTHVVIHFTSNALNNPDDPYKIEDTYNIFDSYGVSAHYVIDRDGQIYLFVEEDRIAYHAGKGQLSNFPEYKDRLNHYSIGIELLAIGTKAEMTPVIGDQNFSRIDESLLGYTDSQYSSLTTLLEDIDNRHPSVKRDRSHIVGHDTYSSGRKTDPGILFDWSRIGM